MAETTEEYRNRINEIANSVGNELYLKDMRDKIAEGISKTGNRQADIEVRQDKLEDDFVAVQQDASSASPSGAEVAVARAGFNTLDERLTTKEQEVTAQLAQKASINYVDAILMDIAKGGPNTGPQGPFMSLSALYSYGFPNGKAGTWLVFDTSFTDGAHSYMWDSTNSVWKDLGVYQATGLPRELNVTEEGIEFPNLASRLNFVDVFTPFDLSVIDFVKGTTRPDGFPIASDVNIITKEFLISSDFNYEIGIVPVQGFQFYLSLYNYDGTLISNTGWIKSGKYIDLSNAYKFKVLIANLAIDSSIVPADKSKITIYYDKYFAEKKELSSNVVDFNNTTWYSNSHRYIGFIMDNQTINLAGSVEVVVKLKSKELSYEKGYVMGLVTSDYDFMSYANPIVSKVHEIKKTVPANTDMVFRQYYDLGTVVGNYIKIYFGYSVDGLEDYFKSEIVDVYVIDSNGVEHHILETGQILKSYANGVVTTKKLGLKYKNNTILDFNDKYSVKYPLHNDKIGFLGDSITFGLDPDNSPNKMQHPWVDQVMDKLKPRKVINYGINSSSICPFPGVEDYTRNPMSRRYVDMESDLDIIGVMGGINDIIYPTEVPLGSFEDRDEAVSLYGGLHVLFKGLATRYKKVFVILYPEYDYLPVYRTDITFQGFLDMVREVANYYAIPILDLSKDSGLSPYIDDEFEYWRELGAGYHDAHPTQKGADVIANVVSNFIHAKFAIE